jgi:four helix bundle protein
VGVIKSYRDLDVFEKAYSTALEIHKITLTFPKIEQYALADQLRRASKGICANIAEGYARHHQSEAEFKRFLFIAMGSSEEVRVWLRFCLDLKYVEKEELEKLDREYDVISKMLFNLHRNWRNKTAA